MRGLRHVAEGGRRLGAGQGGRRRLTCRPRAQVGKAARSLEVPAAVVDKSIADLVPHLEQGDILIDGGNSYYVDDIRRARDARAPLGGQGLISAWVPAHSGEIFLGAVGAFAMGSYAARA